MGVKVDTDGIAFKHRIQEKKKKQTEIEWHQPFAHNCFTCEPNDRIEASKPASKKEGKKERKSKSRANKNKRNTSLNIFPHSFHSTEQPNCCEGLFIHALSIIVHNKYMRR